MYALSGIQSAQTWITQFCLQITPCLRLFVSVHQIAPPLIEVAFVFKFYGHDDPSMAELVEELEERFTAVLQNDNHVLRYLLLD